MGAIANFFGDVVNFIYSLVAAAGEGLVAFFSGGVQVYQNIFSAFEVGINGTPLALFSIVASVGMGYIAARIIIHLL